MKIEWEITKKRGNWRPVLSCTCTKISEEVDLGIPRISVQSTIPLISNNTADKKVFDGNEERVPDWKPSEFRRLETPTSDKESYSFSFFLPWKPGANPEYPEVEESFRNLQKEYEKELKEAYDSAPFESTGSLEMTPETKQHIAPGIVAKKILKAVGESK